MATIRDVAAEAGVSISTVSMVLNSPKRVAPETLDRVVRAIDALGYVPKAEAVARARRAVRRVGVVGPFTSHPAAMRRLAGLLLAAPGVGAEIVVYDEVSASSSVSPRLATLPRSGSLDALVIISHPLDDSIVTAIQERSLPTVLVDTSHPSLSSVRTDDREGGLMAGRHLLAGDLTTAGFIGEAQRSDAYVSPSFARCEGFREALVEAGHTLADSHTLRVPVEFTRARAAARQLLGSADRPDAIFAAHDLLAAGCLAAAHDLGVNVPDDLTILGYDDGDIAETHELSTVHQPFEECGRLAFDALLDSRSRERVRDTVLRLEIVQRRTTRPGTASTASFP